MIGIPLWICSSKLPASCRKLLAVLVALGDGEATRNTLRDVLKGRETAPEAIVAAALVLSRAGLGRDGAGLLERAYALESDTAKRQVILFSLADLYAGARMDVDARRLYANLAADGTNSEIRDRALARLAILLH